MDWEPKVDHTLSSTPLTVVFPSSYCIFTETIALQFLAAVHIMQSLVESSGLQVCVALLSFEP